MVVTAWATSLAAPAADAVLPARSLAWAITGADTGVEIVASCRFSPFTPE